MNPQSQMTRRDSKRKRVGVWPCGWSESQHWGLNVLECHGAQVHNCRFLPSFLLLSAPYFSRGELDMSDKNPEIYEIDYRGPETHSYIPPPNRSGGLPFIHGENPRGHRKSKGLKGGKIGENAQKTHG
ncbi:hypothetical protein CK203_074605 [Vitis vinifera]|uniref:Uncharacterized protein n=1 Tax=Vitis vinifera TaxID=29760 RepID=A0A438DWQ7_VITVI|nr:hypothetical protein CK203_074605 [Vitis vinifera]